MPSWAGPIRPSRRAKAVPGLPVCAVPCLAFKDVRLEKQVKKKKKKTSLTTSLVTEPVGRRPGTGTPEQRRDVP